MAVEWKDGAPPTLLATSARDDVLAALLDAAQVGWLDVLKVLQECIWLRPGLDAAEVEVVKSWA